ncbi:hypothetical protein N0V93_010282 [Gnomoniopsis smithogilvyi]|uniref:Uncharacterized protein n=1 Tax=Gnomoniopsis smithogilvyi TaxID=1191159 RepID=A0A9W8YHV9_9PEZI|nr:hypothetical protein N0V93_010282 [Gnomoniopsis smithogilvyi]
MSSKPPVPQQLMGQASGAEAEAVGSEAPRMTEEKGPERLIGRAHVFTGTFWRWKDPHRFKLPGYIYRDSAMLADPKDQSWCKLKIRNLTGKLKKAVPSPYRYRDVMGRVTEVSYDDRYLHHETGELRKLIVACTDEIFSSESTVTWRRTYVRNCSPLTIRLATWIMDVQGHPDGWWTWCKMAAKTIPGGLLISTFYLDSMEGREQFNGDFAPVLYKYNGTAKVWSNWRESFKNTSTLNKTMQFYQQLGPRLLCFWRDARPNEFLGVDIMSPEEWENGIGKGRVLNYILVTYISEQFDIDSEEDMDALAFIAEKAARHAGVPAYWIAFSCTLNDETQLERDPILSHYLGNLKLSCFELSVIAMKCLFSWKTTLDGYRNGDHTYALMGLLRCRPQVDKTDLQFQAFARLLLANDSDQLLERYLCMLPRSDMQPWHDMSDAYQSLLWDIEPRCQVAGICEDDTVILDGAWGASIRWKSFFPIKCTINDSWRRWLAIQIMLNQGWLLTSASTLFGLLTSNTASSNDAPNTAANSSSNPTNSTNQTTIDWSRVLPDNSPQYWTVFGLGCLLIVIYLLVVVYSAALIRVVYGGKMVDTQAALFGFEGYLDAATVEKSIFGGVFGRMGWSENGSPLSRWHMNEHNERLGVDPVQNDLNVKEMVNRARHAGQGQPRIFTLVDTNSMQMTLFEAARPPVCVILCGTEGGMQRAVGCSYDWATQTMVRETVLRMPTESLDKMSRVPRFRMGVANSRQWKECYPRSGSGISSV